MNQAEACERACQMRVAFVDQNAVLGAIRNGLSRTRNSIGCTIHLELEKYPATGKSSSTICRGWVGTPCRAR